MARGIEHGVVDDDAGSLLWGAHAQVELLRLDVPAPEVRMRLLDGFGFPTANQLFPGVFAEGSPGR